MNPIIINIFNGGYTYLKREWLVVIRITEVTIIQEPDVANIEDLVVGAIEERLKVLCGLQEIWEPDHGWEVSLSSLEESTSQLHLIGFLLVCGLWYIIKAISYLSWWSAWLSGRGLFSSSTAWLLSVLRFKKASLYLFIIITYLIW